MACKVRVEITNKQSVLKIPTGMRLLIRKCCHAVLEHENFEESAEVSVSFVDDAQIRDLNRDFRNIDKSTDVLSFPLGEDDEYDYNNETEAYMLGDIILSLETASRQANEYGHSLEREVGFLTVHSMLHLLGYDHVDDKLEARIMREKEEVILSELGISRDISFVIEHDENPH